MLGWNFFLGGLLRGFGRTGLSWSGVSRSGKGGGFSNDGLHQQVGPRGGCRRTFGTGLDLVWLQRYSGEGCLLVIVIIIILGFSRHFFLMGSFFRLIFFRVARLQILD